MRGKLKRFRVLIFALPILLSLSLAYLPNDRLTEIYFLPLDLNLENIDNGGQEDLVIDPAVQSKGIVSAAFADLSHPGIHPFQDSFRWPFPQFFSEQKISILRC